MADQTLPLNVSYEMKADDERQNCVGMESDEELCSSSSDSAEELYSSSTTDASCITRSVCIRFVRTLQSTSLKKSARTDIRHRWLFTIVLAA